MAETNGTVSTPTLPRSYGDDYAGWIEDTALAIEEGRFAEIDRAALADEVRDLGKSEKRELRSALEVLILNMLKSRYQPEKQTRGWGLTMRVQRHHIAEFLKDSPSLHRELPEVVASAYETARLQAADETGLDVERCVSGQWPTCWRVMLFSLRQLDQWSAKLARHEPSTEQVRHLSRLHLIDRPHDCLDMRLHQPPVRCREREDTN